MNYLYFALYFVFILVFSYWVVWKYSHVKQPSPKSNPEKLLVLSFLHKPSSTLPALIDFVKKSPPFVSTGSSHVFWSEGGYIRVEDDFFGYEVSILPNRSLLDCNPKSYGLTQEEATALFNAILSRVPGSANFREDPERPGNGTYMRCEHCGRGESPNIGDQR